MIDTLLKNRTKADESTILKSLGICPGGYGAMTIPRPSNVDDPTVFARLLDAIEEMQKDLPSVFPIHTPDAEQHRQEGLPGPH
ncbi:hypothetical protein LCGC14_1980310 [marine sediment metagenome]|uniref:Uncharacterized protein n=1 Tax=marine sediment metagenome TaxID=412755 RepID=A0A0F9F933_9ZZZZ